jgi:putative restriction endonuclease
LLITYPTPRQPYLSFRLATRGYKLYRFSVTTLAQAIERLYDLHVGVTPLDEGSPHERPHKPLLLLAVFDLIDDGLATPDRIPWCQELRDRFTNRFEVVRKHNDNNTPDNPFLYLHGDKFWSAWKVQTAGDQSLTSPPLVRDIGHVFARLADGFDILAAIPENRKLMREALVARYFPGHAEALLEVPNTEGSNSSRVEEEPPEYGRNPAFRRKIIEIYDHQCAACGLRIRLPQSKELSFIDAAHLVPFAESHNDHPTNGLALCKNHHWAMDRHLIAPGPEMIWHVSKILQPHRSTGERELLELARRAVLRPNEPAFQPSSESLSWRLERLLA